MIQKNFVEKNTLYGIKTIEILQGDITDIQQVDVVIMSAFQGHYLPIPGTVLGALHQKFDFNLSVYAENPLFDLKNGLNCWVSRDVTVDNPKLPFRHVICYENYGSSFVSFIENLFITLLILEKKGVSIRSVTTPIVGAGSQGMDAEQVVEQLIKEADTHFDSLKTLNRLSFVEVNSAKAQLVSDAIDRHLNRQRIDSRQLEPVSQLRQSLLVRLSVIAECQGPADKDKLLAYRAEYAEKLTGSQRIHDALVTSRKLIEYLIPRMIGPTNDTLTLFAGIQELRNKEVAAWIISFFHTVRSLGNYEVHHAQQRHKPATVSVNDLIVCLYCVDRILEFYKEYYC